MHLRKGSKKKKKTEKSFQINILKNHLRKPKASSSSFHHNPVPYLREHLRRLCWSSGEPQPPAASNPTCWCLVIIAKPSITL